MAEWRVVKSLLVLRDQINALAPNRSKASDGTIGDAAHQAGTSDHNPARYAALGSMPVVCALDVTQDPAHGADMGPIAEALRVSRDRRIGYVIFNHRITGPNHGWRWNPYSGSDPHTNHMHVSTVHTAAADDTAPWQIGDDMPLTQAEKDEIVYRTATIVLAGIQPAGFADQTAPEPYRGQLLLATQYTGKALAEALGVVTAPQVDVKALAAALAGQLNLDQAAVVAALASPEGQAALIKADNAAEDS